MKRVLIVLFTLLLVFLIVPVLPDAAYADDGPVISQEILDSLEKGQHLFDLPEECVKIPGASESKLPGTKSGSVPITTNCFHDSTLPSNGWIAIDSDGDGNNWMYAADYSTFYSLDGKDGQCVTSASFINNVGVLTPDNWLISPAITVPSGKQLDFFVSGQSAEYCGEYYGVYISTTSQTDLSSFHEVQAETVSTGGGVYTGRHIDLRSYAGQTIYIAFRHYNCTDMYWLNLDGLSITDYIGEDPGAPPKIVRIMGKNRYETSIQIALQLLYEMNGAYYQNAIIATGDNFPDALAGSSLSTKYNIPIILISASKSSSIDNAIAFVNQYVASSGTVFILGGEKAVPKSVEERLAQIGYGEGSGYPGNILRFNGKDRYITNLMVLEFLDHYEPISRLLVCDGTNWPDAASASATAYPIMLMPKAGPTEKQKIALDAIKKAAQDDGYHFEIGVIGGTNAVSADVFDILSDYDTYGGAGRLAGKNRAETAVYVALELFDTVPSKVTFAYGLNYPDTISGGILAHFMNAPILYGDNKAPKSYVDAANLYLPHFQINTVYILGGDTLISDQFVIDLFTA